MHISPLLAGAAAFLSLTCTVLAAPNNNGTNPHGNNNGTNPHVNNNGTSLHGTNNGTSPQLQLQGKRAACLTDHEVEILQWRWINFFTNFDPAIANASIAEYFQLFSESTNYVTPNFNQRDVSIRSLPPPRLPTYPNK